MPKALKPGMLARWVHPNGEIVTLVSREYLAYESRFCRWVVYSEAGTRVVQESNLIPV